MFREEEEARHRKEEEEKHLQKLLNQKVPVGKPTNSAIIKAEKVSCRVNIDFLRRVYSVVCFYYRFAMIDCR